MFSCLFGEYRDNLRDFGKVFFIAMNKGKYFVDKFFEEGYLFDKNFGGDDYNKR